MSNLISLLGRLVASLFSTPCKPLDPDDMALRDWADLPPHHPAHDRAPC